MMAKKTKTDILPLPLPILENGARNGILRSVVLLPVYWVHGYIFPILLILVLSSVGFTNVPGPEYDWGAHTKLLCIPMPADADPSCFSSAGVTHGPTSNEHDNGHNKGHGTSHSNGHGNGHQFEGQHNNPSGSSSRRGISDEAKTTILHLRESLVRQKETILDQRETIRELTAKLTLCENFGRGAGGHHDEVHYGHHGTHQSSHHYDSDHHSDPHYPLSGHRNDHHRGKAPYLAKQEFSPEQAGKTLQALKERLENLQARNSSSTYSSSLKDLLQRKINALEEQLHQHYDGNHDFSHQENHHVHRHHDHDAIHRENYHDDHHGDRHDDLVDTHYGHQYHHYYGPRYERHGTHHNGINDHHENQHNDHSDDHHEHRDNHQDSHHNDHHDNGDDHGQQRRSQHKPAISRTRGAHRKLDTVLNHLYHKSSEAGKHKKPKNPDAFQIGFPMHTNYMYCRIKRTLLNEIFALTLCLWLKGGSGQGIGTPFSYSVPGQANEIVLIEWGNSPMELLVNDKAVTLPLSMRDNKWHHLCVTWSTRDGMWEAYQNGMKRGSGENLSPWHPIKPGGVFILGQEQDTLGGRFDATQSFVGEMSDLQVWSRVLNSQEIDNQASCSSLLTGDVISWNESIVELHGGVTKYPFDPCQ